MLFTPGNNKQVISILGSSQSARPGDLTAKYLLGTALLWDHQAEAGQKVLNELLQHGENPGTDLLRGEIALQNGDYTAANTSIDKAI